MEYSHLMADKNQYLGALPPSTVRKQELKETEITTSEKARQRRAGKLKQGKDAAF